VRTRNNEHKHENGVKNTKVNAILNTNLDKGYFYDGIGSMHHSAGKGMEEEERLKRKQNVNNRVKANGRKLWSTKRYHLCPPYKSGGGKNKH
jgi:hypothetical protein